jgi:hypothetical protein
MEDEIRAEAYKIYKRRLSLGVEGDHLSDWYEAARRFKYRNRIVMYERMDQQ